MSPPDIFGPRLDACGREVVPVAGEQASLFSGRTWRAVDAEPISALQQALRVRVP